MADRQYHTSDGIAFALIAGCGLAALRFSSDMLAQSVECLTVVVLLVGVLRARFGPDDRRAFHWGFAFFGATYLGLAYGLFTVKERKDLVTTHVLDRLQPQLCPPSAPNLANWERDRFQLIGHSAFALLAAQAGGVVAGRIAGRAGRSAVLSRDAVPQPNPSEVHLT